MKEREERGGEREKRKGREGRRAIRGREEGRVERSKKENFIRS